MSEQPKTAAEYDQELAEASDAVLERYAAHATPEAYSRSWLSIDDNQRRGIRAANLLSARRLEKERQQRVTAEAQQHQATADQRAAEAKADYLSSIRPLFDGSEADFSLLADSLWHQELTRRMEQRLADERAALEMRYASHRVD